MRHAQKFDSLVLQPPHGVDDVVGGHGNVLHTGTVIILQVFLDLRFALALSRLVDGKFHALVAIAHHLRHQGRVLRADVLVVEMLEQAEAHHIAIEIHPAVHLVPTYVAHHVVDMFQPYRAAHRVRLVDGNKAREKRPAIILSLDKTMDRFAVRGNGGDADFAMLVAQRFRGPHAGRSALSGLAVSGFGVIHPQRYIVDAIAVLEQVRGNRVIGRERRSQHEANLILLEQIGSLAAHAGFGTAVGGELHTESRAVEMRGLLGVADVKFDIVGSIEGQKILDGWSGLLFQLWHIDPPTRARPNAPFALPLRKSCYLRPYPSKFADTAAIQKAREAGQSRPASTNPKIAPTLHPDPAA